MKNLIPIYLAITAFCIMSCMGEDPTIIHQLKENQLSTLKQTFELDLDIDGGTITVETDSGCKFNFDTKGFYIIGSEGYNIAKGKINIDIIEIFDKGTMAITGKHTMSGDSILISGGEFFLSGYQGDKSILNESTYSIEIPINLSGNFSEDMQLFTRFMEGDIQNTILDWRPSRNQSDYWGVFGQDDTSSYTLLVSGFGWFNCDRFMNDPRDRTELNILYPSKYKNKSTAVYLAIKNENNSLGMASQGIYPIGLDVHLIFTVEEDDQFLYQIISTKVSDEVYEFKSDNMNLANAVSLKNIINNLE